MSLVFFAVRVLLNIMETAILVRAIVSWLPIQNGNILINLLYQVTEPILAPINKMIQKSPFGNHLMLDFSPVIALLLIELIKSLL